MRKQSFGNTAKWKGRFDRTYALAAAGVSLFIAGFVLWRFVLAEERARVTVETAMVNVVRLFAQEVDTWERSQQREADRLATAYGPAMERPTFSTVVDWLFSGGEVRAVTVRSDTDSLLVVHCATPRPSCGRPGVSAELQAEIDREGWTGFTALTSAGRRLTLWVDPGARLLPRAASWPLRPSGGEWIYVRWDHGVALRISPAAGELPAVQRGRVPDDLVAFSSAEPMFRELRGDGGVRVLVAAAQADDGRWSVFRIRDAESLRVVVQPETRRTDALIVLLGAAIVGVLLLLAQRAGDRHMARMALRARVEALDARQRAHFIFNALNAVAEFVHEDQRRADAMLVALGTLLRATLEVQAGTLVTLKRELALLDLYVDVERARYGARLRIEVRISEEAESVAVPPWLLQPVVENAIKHGSSPALRIAAISITGDLTDGRLLLAVTDEGAVAARGADDDRAHIGLELVRERLHTNFGTTSSLELRHTPPGGTRVELRIPALGG